jgi:hypothetical protein
MGGCRMAAPADPATLDVDRPPAPAQRKTTMRALGSSVLAPSPARRQSPAAGIANPLRSRQHPAGARVARMGEAGRLSAGAGGGPAATLVRSGVGSHRDPARHVAGGRLTALVAHVVARTRSPSVSTRAARITRIRGERRSCIRDVATRSSPITVGREELATIDGLASSGRQAARHHPRAR